MKKKLLLPCLLLTAVMLLTCVVTLGVGAEEAKTMTAVAEGESVAAGDVVTITGEAELKAFSLYVSNGGVTEGVTFRLTADVALPTDITGNNPLNRKIFTNLNPIGGTYNGASEVQPFKGTFDGGDFTISNLYVTEIYRDVSGAQKTASGAATAYAGLFAAVDGGTVKNLTVTVGSFQKVGSQSFVGVIAATATNGATILNCSVRGESATETQVPSLATGCSAAAGVVGYAKDAVIDACIVSINMTGANSTAGIVGVAEDTQIRNCVVSGTYSHKNASSLGGVAAELAGASVVENCYSSAKLAHTGSNPLKGDVLGGVVGLVGENATVENCFSDADVYADPEVAYGSLVGTNNGAVKHSYGLRDGALTQLDAYADIGLNNNVDATEEVFAFQPKTEGDETVFVVGYVLKERKDDVTCPSCNGTGCSACGGDGKITEDWYTFIPEEGEDTDLVDKLNAWVTARGAETYASWVVNGTTIKNCKHDAKDEMYRDYPGHEATCTAPGLGQLVCSCGLVKQENVETPIKPDAHASESGKIYGCLDYECKYCHAVIKATAKHMTDNIPCKEQECRVCHASVAATQLHTRPDDFDTDLPACTEYECAVCHDTVRDSDHEAPEAEFPCQSTKCSLCQEELPAKRSHDPGRVANCTRNQICLICSKILVPALGHAWGDPATCGDAQHCEICNVPNPDAPATGKHAYDREAATCTKDKTCIVCGYVGEERLGHNKNTAQSVDCGHGISCTRCSLVLEMATADHNVNWETATVIRAATASRTGIVVGVCSDCGREVESYTTYAVMEKEGNATVMGGNVIFYMGSRLNIVFGKVADYKSIGFAEGYIPLQVVTLSVVDASGASIGVSGGVTVKVVLNKSVAKMASNTIKLYQVNGGTATEIAISSVSEGFVSFTASSMGTFVLVGEKVAAFNVLGSLPVQSQQTAALVGTPAYERRDFEF